MSFLCVYNFYVHLMQVKSFLWVKLFLLLELDSKIFELWPYIGDSKPLFSPSPHIADLSFLSHKFMVIFQNTCHLLHDAATDDVIFSKILIPDNDYDGKLKRKTLYFICLGPLKDSKGIIFAGNHHSKKPRINGIVLSAWNLLQKRHSKQSIHYVSKKHGTRYYYNPQN